MAERREKGEGTIYQTANGKWRGMIALSSRDEKGHRKTKTFSGDTELEVKKKIKEWKKEQEKYSEENVRQMSLSTYITNWLTLYKESSLKPNSYKRLKCTVDTHVIPNLGHKQIRDLKTDDIQNLINTLTNSKEPQYSFSSIKKVHDAINSCLQDGVEKSDFTFNPCAAVRLPSVDKRKPQKEIRVFTPEEKENIIIECRRKYSNGKPVYYYGDVYVFLLNTGLRRGEVLGLTWNNVNLEKRFAHIDSILTWQKDKDNNSFLGIQDSTKTSSGVRDVPLNKTAVASLELLKKNPHKKFVLETPEHTHVSPENLERTFYRILNNCSIEKAGLHALRHTFASDMFAKGVDLKTISTILGHSSIAITANIYVSVMKDLKLASVDLLDADENDNGE